MKWTTKEGKTLNVKDMDDNHARNTINMLIKNHSPQVILECILRGDILEQKPEEFKLNGDIAQMHYDMHMEQEYAPDIDYLDTSFINNGL